MTSDGTKRLDALDAGTPARRSQDFPIADLLSELQLTAAAVRDVTPDVLDRRMRALAVGRLLAGKAGLTTSLVAVRGIEPRFDG